MKHPVKDVRGWNVMGEMGYVAPVRLVPWLIFFIHGTSFK
jgi:hypothetical protein